MFTEILKIKPQLDDQSVNTMTKTLNKRFGDVAKKFGSGMKKALIGGGVAALGAALVTKLLNPLKDAEEIINRVLDKGDDIATNAQQFGTSEGKLLNLSALAQSAGLDQETLRQMLQKFQTSLAEARRDELDPTKEKTSAVRAFTGETDTADAFFQFIQSLQALDETNRVLAQNEVFGEKVSGKAADFLGLDFAQQLKDLKLPGADELTAAAKKIGDLADFRDLLAASRDINDFIRKASIINENQIRNIDRSEKVKLKAEDQQILGFDKFKSTSIAIQEFNQKFDKAMLDITTNVMPSLNIALGEVIKAIEFYKEKFGDMWTWLKTIKESKIFRFWSP